MKIFHRKKDISELENRNRQLGCEQGMASCAATIDFLIENIPDNTSLEDLIEKISNITSRWEGYNPERYQKQMDILKGLKK